ncbi:hypothetical protein Sjap_006254 [Stephania japonica]|uniref:DYW domain-containing protein n=1 Tax=Stephania japonica TaxID=461633 RepID=A0AAP0PMM2_9MAGN
MSITEFAVKAQSFLIKNPSFLAHKPSQISYFSVENTRKLLKLFADTKNLVLGKILHAQLITSVQPTGLNVIQTNSLIHLYAKCGELSISRQLFDEMPDRNVVSWSSLLAGYFQNGLPLEALNLFKIMHSSGSPRPNKYVFATILWSCSDARALKQGEQCHCYVFKSGMVYHLYVKNALVQMYLKCSVEVAALEVMKDVPGSDVYTYNLVINGLLEHGYFSKALEVMDDMANESIAWDHITCVRVLGICSGLKDLKMGIQVHNRILRTNVKFDAFVACAIIDMYGKCGQIFSARNAFNGLQDRNVVLWTAIMSASAQNGFFEDALNVFAEMEVEGIEPNELTYAVMLNSCAGLSILRHGDMLNARVVKSGYTDYLAVGNALIHMYAKSGSIADAHQVFSNLPYRDTVTWNSMISGYAHHGLGREALLTFQEMLAVEEIPDYVTFVGVLSACGHLGLVDDGFYYLNQLMKVFGITPGLEHYTCLIGLLGRAGLLDEAENFMYSNHIEWDVVAWRTLLSACHIHRNFKLGKRVAEVILNLNPSDVGTYILLSNMYAKARRWDGVASVRKLMRGRDIKKEPGASWIQIKNKTHVFVADDKKHEDSIQIYEKLAELLLKIKQLGYAPDVTTVLHDVEDEQKEEYLIYHSEKLAIAFGLMNTPLRAPIHIIKNLRMCDDCHAAAKFISKITERKIIVRDANRFHCFDAGTCSCGDYW